MEKAKDEYDALRMLVEILEPFDKEHRERLIKWTTDRLGIVAAPPQSAPPASMQRPAPPHGTPSVTGVATDLKSFVMSKDPKTEVQFAATVAYYYMYEVAASEKKESINKTTLSEAANRIVQWKRGIRNPSQTLVNAFNAGLLDRVAGERGEYRLNMVGENLVGVLLPEGGSVIEAKRPSSRGKRKSLATKKAKVQPKKTKSRVTRQSGRKK